MCVCVCVCGGYCFLTHISGCTESHPQLGILPLQDFILVPQCLHNQITSASSEAFLSLCGPKCISDNGHQQMRKFLALEQITVVHVCSWVFGHKAKDFGCGRDDCTEGHGGEGACVQHELGFVLQNVNPAHGQKQRHLVLLLQLFCWLFVRHLMEGKGQGLEQPLILSISINMIFKTKKLIETMLVTNADMIEMCFMCLENVASTYKTNHTL